MIFGLFISLRVPIPPGMRMRSSGGQSSKLWSTAISVLRKLLTGLPSCETRTTCHSPPVAFENIPKTSLGPMASRSSKLGNRTIPICLVIVCITSNEFAFLDSPHGRPSTVADLPSAKAATGDLPQCLRASGRRQDLEGRQQFQPVVMILVDHGA